MTTTTQQAEAIEAKGLGIRLDDPFLTERRIFPVLSDTERKAFQAAWRILNDPPPETLDWNSFACPGTRQSRRVEWIAGIIREELGR